MQEIFLYVFFVGAGIVLYTYIGYGLFLYIATIVKRPFPIPPIPADDALPFVTILIAAYNEETLIAQKIQNTIALHYPQNKLSILVVTDGSSDRTPVIAAEFDAVKVFHEPKRLGKIHAVNRVMKLVTTPIVVFSDANTWLNPDALKNILRHYESENVGGVAGEKKIAVQKVDNASGSGEGLYWKYESYLKQKDSDLNSVVGAAGELFSIRTSLYEEPLEDMIIEDFYISVRIAMKGHRFIYEPAACALENASSTVAEEWKRKVRIAAGGFQAMSRLLPLLNIFAYGWLSFQYLSHRVLRWTFAPLFLPVILITNSILVQRSLFWKIALFMQLAFYAVAILGRVFENKRIAIKGFFVPYYFCVMNLAVFAGFIRFFKGRQSVVWERAVRADHASPLD